MGEDAVIRIILEAVDRSRGAYQKAANDLARMKNEAASTDRAMKNYGKSADDAGRSTERASRSTQGHSRAQRDLAGAVDGATSSLARHERAQRSTANSTSVLVRALGGLGKAFDAATPSTGTQAALRRYTGLVVIATAALAALAAAAGQAVVALAAAASTAAATAAPVFGLLGAAIARFNLALNAAQLHTKALQTANKDAVKSANDRVVAEHALADALFAVGDAHRKLIDARRDAVRNVEDVIAAERRARLEVSQTNLDLSRSQRALGASVAGGDVGAVLSGQLEVSAARDRISDARRDADRSRADATRIAGQGVEGAPEVVAAKRAVEEAKFAAQQARFAKQQAEQGSAAIQAFAVAMAQLDPAEKKLEQSLERLLQWWDKNAGRFTDPITLALSRAVDGLLSLLKDPRIEKAANDLAQVIAGGIDRFTNAATSEGGRRFIIDMLHEAAKLLPIVFDGIAHLASAFGNLAQGGKNPLRDILEGFRDLSEFLDKQTSDPAKLQRVIEQGRKQLHDIGVFLLGVGQLFASVVGLLQGGDGHAGQPGPGGGVKTPGGGIAGGLADIGRRFSEWAKFVDDNHDSIRSQLGTIATAVTHLADSLTRLADSLDKLAPFLDTLAGLNLQHAKDEIKGFLTPLTGLLATFASSAAIRAGGKGLGLLFDSARSGVRKAAGLPPLGGRPSASVPAEEPPPARSGSPIPGRGPSPRGPLMRPEEPFPGVFGKSGTGKAGGAAGIALIIDQITGGKVLDFTNSLAPAAFAALMSGGATDRIVDEAIQKYKSQQAELEKKKVKTLIDPVAIATGVNTLFNTIGPKFEQGLGGIKKTIEGTGIGKAFTDIFDQLKTSVSPIIDTVGGWFDDLVSGAKDFLTTLTGGGDQGGSPLPGRGPGGGASAAPTGGGGGLIGAVKDFFGGLASGLTSASTAAASTGGGGASTPSASSGTTSTPAAPGLGSAKGTGSSKQANIDLAHQMMLAAGWPESEWPALYALWTAESAGTWSPTIANPHSQAYGIPQSLPGNKMASEGLDWQTNPATQIRWGLKYIRDRPDYGSPSKAWALWQARSPHWYDAGGQVPGSGPVPIVAHGGEMILNPDQQAVLGGSEHLSRLFGFGSPRGGAFARGGRVAKAAMNRAQNTLMRAWRWLSTHFDAARGEEMPPTALFGSDDLYYDTSAAETDMNAAVGGRRVTIGNFVSGGLSTRLKGIGSLTGIYRYLDSLKTVFHEWAHAFQADSNAPRWVKEGGAEAFGEFAAERYYQSGGALGRKLTKLIESSPQWVPKPPNAEFSGYVDRIIKAGHLPWILRGQFGLPGGGPRPYEQGGHVPGEGPVPIIAHGGEAVLPKYLVGALRRVLGRGGGAGAAFEPGGVVFGSPLPGRGTPGDPRLARVAGAISVPLADLIRNTAVSLSGVQLDFNRASLGLATLQRVGRALGDAVDRAAKAGAGGVQSFGIALENLTAPTGLFARMSAAIDRSSAEASRRSTARGVRIDRNAAGATATRTGFGQDPVAQAQRSFNDLNAARDDLTTFYATLSRNAVRVARLLRTEADPKKRLLLVSAQESIGERLIQTREALTDNAQGLLASEEGIQQAVSTAIAQRAQQRDTATSLAQRIAEAAGRLTLTVRQGLLNQQQRSLEQQRTDIGHLLQRAEGSGNKDLADQLRAQSLELDTQLAELAASRFQATIDDVNATAQRRLGGNAVKQRIAQALGRQAAVPGLLDQQGGILADQRAALVPLLARAKKQGNTTLARDLDTQVGELDAQLTELTVSRFNATVEAVKAPSERRGAAIGVQQRVAQALGDKGSQAVLAAAAIQNTRDGIAALSKQLANAPSPELRGQLQAQIDDLKASVTELTVSQFNDGVEAVKASFDRRGAAIGRGQRVASALGNSGAQSQLVGEQIQNARDEIQALAVQAAAAPSPELAAQLGEQIADLQTSIVELAAQQLQQAVDLVNQNAATQLGANEREQARAQLGSRTDFGRVGTALAGRGSILEGQLAQLEGLRGAAAGAGNQTVADALTQQIEDLKLSLEQNADEVRKNTDAQVADTIQRRQSSTTFRGGALGRAAGILQSLGLDPRPLLQRQRDTAQEAVGGDSRSLASIIAKIDPRVAGELSNTNSPAEVVRIITEDILPRFDGFLERLDPESGGIFSDLVSSILDNTSATVDLTKQLGATTDPQTFSSSAWTQFRSAIFNGLGGVLPQYTSPGSYSGGIGGIPAGPQRQLGSATGGDTHLTVNVNEAGDVPNATELGRTLAFVYKTAVDT